MRQYEVTDNISEIWFFVKWIVSRDLLRIRDVTYKNATLTLPGTQAFHKQGCLQQSVCGRPVVKHLLTLSPTGFCLHSGG